MTDIIKINPVEELILFIRGQQVILDAELAKLYEMETGALKRAVRRNIGHFPDDFMFVLTSEEERLICQNGTSKNTGRGGKRHASFAFTQEGIAMLSSVLRSEKAIQVNIEIMRGFVKLRKFALNYSELSKKIAEHDGKFEVVFKAIDTLNKPITLKKPKIGFKKTI